MVAFCGCGNGSNSDLTAFSLSLQSDAPCYGARAQIDLDALAGTRGACSLRAALTAAGCRGNVHTQGHILVAEARGCMIEAGTALFDCELQAAGSTLVEDAATVTCGCGCQQTCPTATTIEASTTSPATRHDATSSAQPGARGRSISVETLALATTSTTCGTCCDYGVTASLNMQASRSVSEIEFVLALDGAEPCPFEASDCELTVATDGPGFVRKVGRTLEVCLADSTGIDAAAEVMRCELLVPSYGSPPIEVLRARDDTLEALDPLPALTVREDP